MAAVLEVKKEIPDEMFYFTRMMIAFGILVGFFASGSVLTQERKTEQVIAVPSGLVIDGLLKTDLSSKYSKVGDPVELEVVHNSFHARTYQLLLADHTRLLGTITMVRRSSKGEAAALAIRITEARQKTGQSTALNGVLGTAVLIYHDYTGPVGESGRTLREYNDLVVFTDGSVKPDSQLGAVLYCKHDFYLMKGKTQLEIVTRSLDAH